MARSPLSDFNLGKAERIKVPLGRLVERAHAVQRGARLVQRLESPAAIVRAFREKVESGIPMSREL